MTKPGTLKPDHSYNWTSQPKFGISSRSPMIWFIVVLSFIIGLNYFTELDRDSVAAYLTSKLGVVQQQVVTTHPDHPQCHASHFDHPKLHGAKILSIHASPVSAHTAPALFDHNSPFTPSLNNLSFCNVTLVYTRPNVPLTNPTTLTLWLPAPSTWNNRYLSTGGGGYASGLGDMALGGPVSRGYAVATTSVFPSLLTKPSSWALLSPGNVNLNTFQHFATQCLLDMSHLALNLTTSYYGRNPSYTYFEGCSTGGRQALTLAQRLPSFYDGILSIAPAANWPDFLIAELWPQLIMTWSGLPLPDPCELDAITRAAIEDCDWRDGVVDGIISEPDKCRFSPDLVVGNIVHCPGHPDGKKAISPAAVHVAKAVWDGPRNPQGERLWFGLPKGTPLGALAGTKCDYTTNKVDGDCVGAPFGIAEDYVKLFIWKRPTDETKLTDLTHQEYADLFQQSKQQYESFVGSRDADLSPFARAGGKMLLWHGVADDLIFVNGSRMYYENVLEHFAEHRVRYRREGEGEAAGKKEEEEFNDVRDFFRYYEAPGVNHCMFGPGPYPGKIGDASGALDQLIDWVEKGVQPDVLDAISEEDSEGRRMSRPLCMWPKVARFSGKGDWRDAGSWGCMDPE